MPAVFSSQAGMVSRVQSSRGVVPFRVNIGDLGQKCIVTQAGVDLNGNFQALHTVGDVIDIYIFGDRIGELVVAGLAFMDLCGAGQGESGPRQALNYYERNRLAARGTPTTVQYGDATFRGILTGAHVEVVKPDSPIGQFVYRFNVLPAAR